MNELITLYGYTFRSRAERVLWVLEELQLEYEIIRVNPFDKSEIKSKFLSLNPEGKVPILKHGDKILTESLAIMEYLVLLENRVDLLPKDAVGVYEFRKKIHYILTEIEPYLWLAEQSKGPLKALYNWPEGVYEEGIRRADNSCKKVSTFLVGGAYLLEGGFSIADIYSYHVLTWMKQHGIEHDEVIEKYLLNLEKRASFPSSMYWK